jgi:VWFA-related protein
MWYNLPVRIALTSALALDLAAGPALLSAQQTSAEIPGITIRTSTRLVVVDVVVTDKKGQPIPGLKPEDFTMEENGKKQKIATFTPPGAGEGSPQTPPPGVLSNHPEFLKPAGVPTVLVLDAANSSFKDQAYGRSQMLKYALEQNRAGKPMAVMTLTDRLRVLQNFTTDPKILTTAIENLTPQSQPLPRGGSVPGSAYNGSDYAGANGSLLAQAIVSARAQVAGFQNVVAGYNLEIRMDITLQALQDLTRMLSGFSGRKNVVWLTADFPLDLVPDDKDVSSAELAAELPSLRQRSVSSNAAGSAFAEQRLLHVPEIKQAEANLASSGIAIYPVDMRGIMTSGIDVNTTFALQDLAAETGGKAYTNQNEIKDGIELAVADENASYSLGYYPENKKWDGKFRALKVKLDRPDTEVRYRKGYFALDPMVDKNWKPEQEAASALQMTGPATQVSFMAQVKPTDPGKARIVFLVDAHTLSTEDASDGKKMNVSFYAGVYDANGKSLGGARSIKVEHTFDAATLQQVLDKGLMVPLDIAAPADGKQVRLVVLDNRTGFLGTVSGPLGP